MPAAHGEDHPGFMRTDHSQLAEDCRALKREKAAAPNETQELISTALGVLFWAWLLIASFLSQPMPIAPLLLHLVLVATAGFSHYPRVASALW
jgi:hypothetical protein